ncbi:MAG TPA: class II SORL domain-containing protein [Methanoregulaceae archaeon]|nr:class II SORL domain-containing protein [Methanoregulaceae archaeon]
MAEKKLSDMINTYDGAAGEALGKRESHTPRIEAPESVKADEVFEVRVSVGPHPNTVEHSIRRIVVYFEEEGRAFNPITLGMVFFNAPTTDPDVVLKVKVPRKGIIHAIEYCNLHGIWSARKAIMVE